MDNYMYRAYELAQIAFEQDEIPIGAVIVYNNQIIGEGHNTKESSKDVTCHAEINAIKEASSFLGRWHLDDCTLYTTLEPCMMCTGAIIQSRIKNVMYGAPSSRWDGFSKLINGHVVNHTVNFNCSFDQECSLLISQYFKNKRKRQ